MVVGQKFLRTLSHAKTAYADSVVSSIVGANELSLRWNGDTYRRSYVEGQIVDLARQKLGKGLLINSDLSHILAM